MQTYIDENLFKKLEKTTLKCGGNLAGNTYIRFFQNKDNMSREDYENFKRDVIQEFQIQRQSRIPIPPQIEEARDQLRKLI